MLAWCVGNDRISPTKTDKPIEIQSAAKTHVSSRNRVPNGILASPDEYNGMICAPAVMRAVAAITVVTCLFLSGRFNIYAT